MDFAGTLEGTVVSAWVAEVDGDTDPTVLKLPPTVVTIMTPKELVVVNTEPAEGDEVSAAVDILDCWAEGALEASVIVGCWELAETVVEAGLLESEARVVAVTTVLVSVPPCGKGVTRSVLLI